MENNVEISLPSSELSDVDSLKYVFEKYLFSVERGKPCEIEAAVLKIWIDIIQQKHLNYLETHPTIKAPNVSSHR